MIGTVFFSMVGNFGAKGAPLFGGNLLLLLFGGKWFLKQLGVTINTMQKIADSIGKVVVTIDTHRQWSCARRHSGTAGGRE